MKLKITSLKALMLIAICFFSVRIKAADTYDWQMVSIASFTGGNTYALNATAASLTLAVNQCAGGIQQPHNSTNVTVTVYSNTTNSTTGGTIVSQFVQATSFLFAPTYVVYTPSTSTAGTLYYYVVLSNPSMSTCGFTGTLTSSTTAVTVTCQSVSLNTTSQNVSCFGLSDGTASVSATGGSGFTYAWSNGVTTATNNNIPAGVYTCTVTNSCSSSATASVTVSEPNAVEVTVSGNTTIVFGNSTTLTASGANSYQWNPGNTTASITVAPTATTNYTVIGTVDGCADQNVVTVVVTPPSSPNGEGNPDVDTTELRSAYCGLIFNTMGRYIYCNPVAGATNYEYKFSIAGTVNSIYHTRGTNNTDCYLNWVSGLQYGVDYDVYVRAQVGGVWGVWGTSCILSITNTPETKIRQEYCGTTLATIGTPIYCEGFINATRYRFHIMDNTLMADYYYTSIGTDTKFIPQWIPQMQNGGNYTIEVAMELNGSFTPYGTECAISIGAIPTTKIRNAYCGWVSSTFKTAIYSDPVPGATAYEYEITNLTSGGAPFTYIKTGGTTAFYPHLVPGIVHNKTYSIRVRAIIGTNTGSYGSACNLTLGVPAARLANDLIGDENADEISEKSLSVLLFPNPTTDVLNVQLSKSTAATAVVTDITGRVLMTIEMNDLTSQIKTSDLAEGSYWITVKSTEGYSVQKFMVIK